MITVFLSKKVYFIIILNDYTFTYINLTKRKDNLFMNNYLEISSSTENLPLEYNFLKWRLIINQELYENHLIDVFTFRRMEESLISRLTNIKNK